MQRPQIIEAITKLAKQGKQVSGILTQHRAELAELRQRVAKLEAQTNQAQYPEHVPQEEIPPGPLWAEPLPSASRWRRVARLVLHRS